jgi:tetratricopeptide (TPR) repeat protein
MTRRTELPHVIGRQRELGAVAQMLDDARRGRGRLMVVTGPPGSGRTTIVDAAAALAANCGLAVERHDLGPDLWAVLGVAENTAPRLIIVDDIDWAGPDAAARLSRLSVGSSAVLVTARTALGVGQQVRLGALTAAEIAAVAGVDAEDGEALWLASSGFPGRARSLAAVLDGRDPYVALALLTPSRAEFLDVDDGLVALIEAAVVRTEDDDVRARLLARLAAELLGDASAGPRRRAVADDALVAARRSGLPLTIATVLDARLHALWDPSAAAERLTVASEIMARSARDPALQRRGQFWQFVALIELGDVAAASSALAAYARAAELAGDDAARVVVTSRHAMLAIMRGNYDDAVWLMDDVSGLGYHAGVPDTERLVATLRGALAADLGGDPEPDLAYLRALTRRMPGHFFEAVTARILAAVGRYTEAGVEAERLLPRLLAGSGPRWLGAAADLATAVCAVGNLDAAEALYTALLPYDGRLVTWGGANTVTGPVGLYLGLLAVSLARPADAITHLDAALAMCERNGSLPAVARLLHARATVHDVLGDPVRAEVDRHRSQSLVQRLGMRPLGVPPATSADTGWWIRRDADDWLIDAGLEHLRIRDGRGLHYLAALLAAPGLDIDALDLAAGGTGLHSVSAEPVLDDTARHNYRRRLEELNEQLDTADRTGDQQRAGELAAERDALVASLRQASGLGGRRRAMPDETERARVNVTRTLRATIARIAESAPALAAHLTASVRTGRQCRYQPAAGGPPRWRT